MKQFKIIALTLAVATQVGGSLGAESNKWGDLKKQPDSGADVQKKQGVLNRVEQFMVKPVIYGKVYRSSIFGAMTFGLGTYLLYKSNYLGAPKKNMTLEVENTLRYAQMHGILGSEYADELSNEHGFMNQFMRSNRENMMFEKLHECIGATSGLGFMGLGLTTLYFPRRSLHTAVFPLIVWSAVAYQVPTLKTMWSDFNKMKDEYIADYE